MAVLSILLAVVVIAVLAAALLEVRRSLHASATGLATLADALETVESELILQGLIRTHWNKSQLAKELGISRSYLIQKCAQYGLERKD